MACFLVSSHQQNSVEEHMSIKTNIYQTQNIFKALVAAATVSSKVVIVFYSSLLFAPIVCAGLVWV